MDVVQEVKKFFPNQVFENNHPPQCPVGRAPSFGQPISIFAPESSAAKAYSSFAREILEGDGVKVPVTEE